MATIPSFASTTSSRNTSRSRHNRRDRAGTGSIVTPGAGGSGDQRGRRAAGSRGHRRRDGGRADVLDVLVPLLVPAGRRGPPSGASVTAMPATDVSGDPEGAV